MTEEQEKLYSEKLKEYYKDMSLIEMLNLLSL